MYINFLISHDPGGTSPSLDPRLPTDYNVTNKIDFGNLWPNEK